MVAASENRATAPAPRVGSRGVQSGAADKPSPEAATYEAPYKTAQREARNRLKAVWRLPEALAGDVLVDTKYRRYVKHADGSLRRVK